MSEFKALVLEEADGKVTSSIRTLTSADLPDGDVVVDVSHSSLNYKDGMVVNGLGRLVRKYPHVPGIDFAGRVEASASPEHKPGDYVVLTGWRVGEQHWGGYAQKARVKAGWLVPLAAGLTPARAMAVGTAGLTAMLAVLALERHGLKPGSGPVLVTGAAGGLGSMAVAVLAKLGYEVFASTGRTDTHDYLKGLGAASIVDRTQLAAAPERPLLSEKWEAAIDSVGGPTLANVLAGTKYGCSVAACGLAGGNSLPTTVLPFILRGVNLLGIDSVMCPPALRNEAWMRVARDLPPDVIDRATTMIGMGELPDYASRILKGQVRGRVVVDVNT